ncbi:MAG: hypothetical protein ABI771_15820 [Betaproteobacteria bacterium]
MTPARSRADVIPAQAGTQKIGDVLLVSRLRGHDNVHQAFVKKIILITKTQRHEETRRKSTRLKNPGGLDFHSCRIDGKSSILAPIDPSRFLDPAFALLRVS